MPTELRFELINDSDELPKYEDRWRKLSASAPRPSPMADPSWALTWWRFYSGRRSLAVGLFFRGDELVGLAPLCVRNHRYMPGLSFRRLQFMGGLCGDDDGVCGEYLNVLAHPGDEADVAAAFTEALLHDRFGGWDECILEGIDAEYIGRHALEQALRVGFRNVRSTCSASTTVVLPADWDSYLLGLPSGRRKKVRRQLREFEAWAGVTGWELHRAHDQISLETGMNILSVLHEGRWLAEGQTGSFASSRFRDFHSVFAANLLQRGSLELLWMTIDGKPVASNYSFTSEGRAFFYQCGRSTDVPAHLSVGTVMLLMVIKDFIARGLTELDMLAGDSTYKSRFGGHARPIVQIRVARPSKREQLLRLLRATRRFLPHGGPFNQLRGPREPAIS